MKKLLFWLPRILSIIITGFFAIFILEGLTNWQDGLAHLVLALVVLGVTILAWKKPLVGGSVFLLFGLSRITIFFYPAPLLLLLGALPIVLIPLLTGGLFVYEGFNKKNSKT